MSELDLDWEVPRCSHGHIILACDDDACPEQGAYLADHQRRLDEHYELERQAARDIVRKIIGR